MTPIHLQKLRKKHPHGSESRCDECELLAYIDQLTDESSSMRAALKASKGELVGLRGLAQGLMDDVASLRQGVERLREAGNGLDAATSMSDLCQDEIQAARDAWDAALRETERLDK